VRGDSVIERCTATRTTRGDTVRELREQTTLDLILPETLADDAVALESVSSEPKRARKTRREGLTQGKLTRFAT